MLDTALSVDRVSHAISTSIPSAAHHRYVLHRPVDLHTLSQRQYLTCCVEVQHACHVSHAVVAARLLLLWLLVPLVLEVPHLGSNQRTCHCSTKDSRRIAVVARGKLMVLAFESEGTVHMSHTV